MATPSSGPGSIHYSAHSNPNLAHNLHYAGNGILARSSSHPPEIFYWDGTNSPPPFQAITMFSDKETQTTYSNGDIEFVRQFVLKHPEEVLNILGLDVDKVMCTGRCVRKCVSVPGHCNLARNNSANLADFINFSTTITVDHEEEESDELGCNDEECPFLWNHQGEGESRRSFYSAVQEPLLKHRKANFES